VNVNTIMLCLMIGFGLGYYYGYKSGKRIGSRKGYAAGRRKGSNECFVATAAAGSADAPEVRILRRFRDEVLLTSSAGKQLVKYYYKIGPKLARSIEGSPVMRRYMLIALVRPASEMADKILKKRTS